MKRALCVVKVLFRNKIPLVFMILILLKGTETTANPVFKVYYGRFQSALGATSGRGNREA